MPEHAHPWIWIIGAGPVGLCAALALQDKARSVGIVDAGHPGAGWASGGMLAPLYELLADPDCPPAFARFGFESLTLWADVARACDLPLASPALFLARTQAELDRLSHVAARAQTYGQRVVPTQCPSGLTALAAFVTESETALDPRQALAKLKSRFQAQGGTILTAQVDQLGPGKFHSPTLGWIGAEHVILANGYAAHGLSAQIPAVAHMRPVKGQMMRLAHPGLSAPIVRAGRLYLLSRGASLVVGATSDPNAQPDTGVLAEPLADLRRELAELAPSLATELVVESWAGLRPDTPDHLPLLGPSGIDGIWLATGTYRNGWLLAPAMAALLANWIAEGNHRQAQTDTLRDTLADLFAPGRFSR